MKKLTDKELAVLGGIGYLLECDQPNWLLVKEKIVEFGFQEQVVEYHDRMVVDIENLEFNINNLLVQAATDIIEGVSPNNEE